MNCMTYQRNRGNTNLVFAIILLAMGGVGYYAWNQLQSAIEPDIVYNFQFSEAKREFFTHTIKESGDIESAQNEEVKCIFDIPWSNLPEVQAFVHLYPTQSLACK